MSDAAKAITACTGLLERAVPHCAPAVALSPPLNADALAVPLAAQANAISAQANYLTFATLVLGVIAVFLTLGWGLLVKIWAEKAASDAVSDWMGKNANDLISQRLAVLMPPQTDGGGSTRPPMSQQEQEKGLGGDPAKDPG